MNRLSIRHVRSLSEVRTRFRAQGFEGPPSGVEVVLELAGVPLIPSSHIREYTCCIHGRNFVDVLMVILGRDHTNSPRFEPGGISDSEADICFRELPPLIRSTGWSPWST